MRSRWPQAAEFFPEHVKLLGRWLDLLYKAGYLERDGLRFVSRASLPNPDIDSAWREAEAALSGDPFLLEYLRNCTRHLRGVLLGTTSPLETLFPGGSPDLAKNLYENAGGSGYANLIVAAAVQAACHAAPKNRRLRIVELGGGTGATASAILPRLPAGRVSYYFTDISELFLQKASERFSQYPFVRYGLLDIETEAHLALHRGSFDVVIAANVVHATRDVQATLSGIAKLLAPGGTLILLETTRDLAWHDITIGLVRGWEKSEDLTRQGRTLLNVDEWTAALRETGFDEVFSAPEAGSPASDIGLHVVMAKWPVQAAVEDEAKGTFRAPEETAWMPSSLDDATAVSSMEALLREAPATERHGILLDAVRDEVARVLRMHRRWGTQET